MLLLIGRLSVALQYVQSLTLMVSCARLVIIDGEQLPVVWQVVDAEVFPLLWYEWLHPYLTVHRGPQSHQPRNDKVVVGGVVIVA